MDRETFRKRVDGIVQYAPDIISAESIEKKLSDIGYPAGEGKSGIRSDIISAAAVLLLPPAHGDPGLLRCLHSDLGHACS